MAGPLVGRAFELGVGSWVIGRAVAADVRLKSLAVSRMHAKLIGSRVALKRVLIERGSVARKESDHPHLGRTT